MTLRTLVAFLAIGSTLSMGCFNSDDDKDDDDDEEESEDGGGVGGDEDLDSDGDGLTDAEEAELGLDPENADTDYDGFEDGEEVSAETDPASCWSVPEGWSQCVGQATADGVSGTGYAVGETVPNWTAWDQNGDEVEFWQFYSQVVVLDMSAGWCGPCRSAAESAESEFQEHKEDGVQFVHLMIDDNSYDGYVTDEDFVSDWASEYGLSFPVVWDDSTDGYATAYVEFYYEDMVSGVPTFVVIDQDMVVHDYWAGTSASQLSAAINELISD